MTDENPFSAPSGESERLSGGPTLPPISLLAIAAVLFVGIALLLPSVQGAKEVASQTQCKSDHQQIGLPLHATTTNWDCLLPLVQSMEAKKSVIGSLLSSTGPFRKAIR